MSMPVIVEGATPRSLLAACGGWYHQVDGSPLVGYAGRYGAEDKQLVGRVYANFSAIEKWPTLVRTRVAYPLSRMISTAFGNEEFVFCAAPEGGKMLGQSLASYMNMEYAHPEKVVTAPKTATSREKTELRFCGRHTLTRGKSAIIVEDTCNNFSTSAQFIEEIKSQGCTVLAIVCFLNRSPKYHETFTHNGIEYPVVALWNEVLPEYTQEDMEVADDIASGNVIWKPKDDWLALRSRASTNAFV